MIVAGLIPASALAPLRAIRAMGASTDEVLRWMESDAGLASLAAAYPLDDPDSDR